MNDTVDKELASLGYPQHILDGFAQGALLDFRMRFAMQLLTTSPIFGGVLNTDAAAKNALDIADAVFKQAEARGWVTAIDHDAPLPDTLAKQAARLGAFQVHQQTGANEEMKRMASPIATMNAPGIGRTLNG